MHFLCILGVTYTQLACLIPADVRVTASIVFAVQLRVHANSFVCPPD